MGDEGEAVAAPNVVFVPSNIPLPGKLDIKGNLSTNWKKFKRVWSNYEIASNLRQKDNEMRTATFLTCVGANALELFDGFHFENENDKTDIDKVIEAFETFCIGQTNEIYERYTFNRRDQENNENIDSYVASLRSLSKTCKFGTLEDEMIRDRIVIGIRDNGTRKKLLQEAKLDLKRCIDICRANEKSATQVKEIGAEDVQAIRKKQKNKTKINKTPVRTEKRKERSARQCIYCGNEHEFRKEKCPAWGKECSICHNLNHFAKKCPFNDRKAKRQQKVNFVDDDSSSEEVLQVETINDIQKRLYAELEIEGQRVKFLLDCGATVNVINESLYKSLYRDDNLSGLRKDDMTLVMFNKTEVKPTGTRRVSVRNPKNRKKYSIEMVVVPGNLKPILGSKVIQGMKMITVNQENIAAVESTDVLERFTDVFQGLGKFQGTLHLDIDKSIPPTKIPTRKVPLAVKKLLKEELERLTDLGVITPVTEPTDWISSLVAVKKPTGKMRLCIDPKPLNKALKRSHYTTPTIEDILPELNKAKVFSVLDCKDGFWHVELDEQSSLLTTFGTPWGRFRWLRMPFGIKPASEEFQRRIDEALEGLSGIKAVHDDIVVWGSGDTDQEAMANHDANLENLLKRCRQKGVKINKDKMKLKLDSVSYLGHVISKDGLKVDPNKTKAIVEMPTPTTKADIQRLLGMANYLQKFAPNLSTATAPIRDLLKENNEFLWDDTVHGKAFQEMKNILSTAPALNFFDPKKSTVIQCDASERGLGACISQQGRPIAYASRALTPTEVNYAQIEKELLAVVFAMEKFEHYTFGRHVVVESDHKPLEIIVRKSLTSAPKRLQRMLMRLQKFDYEIIYKSGKEMYVADTLSRAYLKSTKGTKPFETVLNLTKRSKTEEEAEDIDMREYTYISDVTLRKLEEHSETDETIKMLKKIILQGWPEDRTLPTRLEIYYPFREELTVQGNLVYKGDRIVLPGNFKSEILQRIHSSHIGIQNCVRRAREALYWPNMTADITNYVQQCAVCAAYQTDQCKEPLISHEIPDRPWQKIGTDLFQFDDRNYLITVDYYSDFFEIDRLHDKKSKEVISKLKAHFARYGIPEIVISDNGPPFNSREFLSFAEKYEFNHITSSPLYPKSNGKVENAVKIAKRLMRKSQIDNSDPFLALLDWRNTPTEIIGSSAAQRLMGRRTRTKLPIKSSLLAPETQKNVKESIEKRKQKSKQHYDKNARPLPELNTGDVVRIKPFGRENKWTKAKVDEKVNIRSYQVTTEDGRTYRRNRRHLRPTSEMFTDDTPSQSIEPQTRDVNKSISDQNINDENASQENRYPTRERRPPTRFKDFVVYK
ncbi:hypothetical protein FSP39_018986 [Pinctada imbricata]|uniref:RNA-directed DNA polymerase n=1 Tax=Pinctada imbricata TaxID=66713 RepID=A0AA89BMS7_PINIB|nr:hypothetical protein FSP39_018986 [Pinctada imbricata]